MAEGTMRILITEDDIVGRKVLALFLEPFGECVTAARGDEALELFRASRREGKPFNLILLDVGLPGLGGVEVLRQIRGDESASGTPSERTPVIMLTGQSDVNTIVDAQTLGISRYLLKPIEESSLLKELARLGLIPDSNDQWS